MAGECKQKGGKVLGGLLVELLVVFSGMLARNHVLTAHREELRCHSRGGNQASCARVRGDGAVEDLKQGLVPRTHVPPEGTA